MPAYASSAKIASAEANLGGPIALDSSLLLKQLVVALGNVTGGGGGGSGTVTSFSFTDGAGITGVVTNPTTTPALALTLGAITPTSVNGLTLAAAAVGFTIEGGTTSKTLTVLDTGTAALLGIAQTFTAANIFSVNGAASTPALSGTGTIFTGGSTTTTKPYWLIEPTGTKSTGWSTSGTLFGANAPSGFAGNHFDFQTNGVSKLKFNGALYFGGDIDIYNGASASRLYMAGNVIQAYFAGVAHWQVDNGGVMGVRGSISLPSTGSLDFSSTTGFSGSKDVGLARTSAGIARVSNGSSGRGTLDAAGYQVGGVAGVSFSGVATNLTIVNGIVTAAS